MASRLAAVAALLLLGAPLASLRGQQLAALGGDASSASGPLGRATATAAVAVRAATPPVLDGKDDDPIWRDAQTIDAFEQFQPTEGGPASLRTVAKVVYDDRYLYVLVRMYDPHPDSIVSLLSRRDVRTPSDWIKVMLDSYHDRRTGYEFAVNALGVKRDYYMYNDNTEDESWDGVWDVATAVDSIGWVAEYRIPFAQLRFPRRAEHTFGIAIWRDIARYNERDSWPLYRNSRAGISSQLGELSGIRGIATPLRLELMPYVVSKSSTVRDGPGDFGSVQNVTAGADIKYGVTSNLTLDATVNPDFGQVEADPAVLNLSAFETFFQEKRPFFIEGMGIFRFDLNCNDGLCSGLFYSRRVGRAPQLSDGEPRTPTATTILGAGKLTGRLANGLSIGVLDAITQREVGSASKTVEPASNYAVARLQQDFRGGQSGIGLMVTGVSRSLDASSLDSLRRSAFTAGLDARHRFGGGNYQVSGYVVGSRVQGDTGAIALTQRSGAHLFQRPDDHVRYDPGRTSLAGDGEQIEIDKVGGDVTRFSLSYQRFAPGFEANDVGFLRQAGTQNLSAWFALQFFNPAHFYRAAIVNFNAWQGFVAHSLRAADRISSGGNINAHVQLKNSWWLHAGLGPNALGETYCGDCAFGGPAIRLSRSWNSWWGVEGDQRLRFAPNVFGGWTWNRTARYTSWYLDPAITARLSSSFSATIGPHYERHADDAQYLDTFIAGADTSYTFGRLAQQTLGITARVDYTITPTLSIQVYAQPYVSRGTYTNWKTFADPRSARYADRFRPYAPDDPSQTVSAYDFAFGQFRSNTVLRWEYRPGSTLFVVWSQGRDQDDSGTGFGTFRARRNLDDLFAQHPNNTLLVKAAYWFHP